MGEQRYVYPLKQHIGVPSECVVQVGQSVKKGSLLARIPTGCLSANLHSSVYGEVVAITETAIEIQATAQQPDEFVPIDGCSVRELIENAGIVGMGGAGFPTHVKLGVPLEKGGCVIVNAAECEPILSHNITRIEKMPDLLYRGLLYAMETVEAKQGIIAIKAKHETAIQYLKDVIGSDDRIKIALLPDLYPMGEERAILRETLGILLKPGQLPLAANTVVVNAETTCRIAEAVELKKPCICKDVTIAGVLRGNPEQIYLDVPLGTLVENLLERSGGTEHDYGEILMGGPFTGYATELGVPVIKTSGGILVTMPFLKEQRPIGLLVCACGASQKRMEEIAAQMEAPIVAIEACKQAEEMGNGMLKCRNPGCCPGQAETVLRLKKAGAKVLLIGNCTDCTNTVMALVPKLHLPVYHTTDHVLRAVHSPLIRKMKLRG
ncbi:MAG: proline reductase-associated electron transfer protein PrdC [Veillonellales bacterium]